VVPRLEALALSSNLLEMLIPGPVRPTESETLGMTPNNLCFNNPMILMGVQV